MLALLEIKQGGDGCYRLHFVTNCDKQIFGEGNLTPTAHGSTATATNTFINGGTAGTMRATNAAALGELVDADRLLNHNVMYPWGVSDVILDDLGGVMMFGLVRLSLNDRLNLFYDVLIHTLVYDRSVDGSRVGGVTDISLIAKIELILVLCCGSIIDVFSAVSRNGRSIVLVASGLSLFVKDRLYFLVDFRLLPSAVDDRGDLVVRVPIYLFTDDGIFDISGVSSANSVFDIDPAGLSVGECLRSRASTILMSLVFSHSSVVVAEGAHDFVYDTHI